MLAVRGCWNKHPVTEETGIWLELSTDSPGTITGISLANLAVAVVKTGNDTLSTYSTKVTSYFQTAFCNKILTNVTSGDKDYKILPSEFFIDAQNRLVARLIVISITFSSLTPLVVGEITISEGAARMVKC